MRAEEHLIEVLEEDTGKRLDIFLSDFSRKQKLGLSRMSLQKLITAGNILIDEEPVLKPHHKIKSACRIKIRVPAQDPRTLSAEEIPLKIVYEDKDLAVIEKQSGLVVHPAPGNREHTLVNALLSRFKDLSSINPERPGIVHRLDKETSGLLVIAKNNSTHLGLAEQFSCHSIKRKYLALVKGSVKFDEDVIELPIARHPQKRENMHVGYGKDSRFAKTIYRTRQRSGLFSFLELEPFTGRTHQLRVHLSFIGHPILGDSKYGKNNEFPRLALHASYLGFVHPGTGKFIEFSSDMPKEFKEFLGKNKGK